MGGRLEGVGRVEARWKTRLAGVGVSVIRGPSIDTRYVRAGLHLESTMGWVDSGGLCIARLIDSGDEGGRNILV